jgi:uncharacterized protein
MPDGKPAGVVCANLDPQTYRCLIWKTPEYPEVCRNLRAEPEMCGANREEALAYLTRLEALTRP